MSIENITIDCVCSYCQHKYTLQVHKMTDFDILGRHEIFKFCKTCRTGIKPEPANLAG